MFSGNARSRRFPSVFGLYFVVPLKSWLIEWDCHRGAPLRHYPALSWHYLKKEYWRRLYFIRSSFHCLARCHYCCSLIWVALSPRSPEVSIVEHRLDYCSIKWPKHSGWCWPWRGGPLPPNLLASSSFVLDFNNICQIFILYKTVISYAIEMRKPYNLIRSVWIICCRVNSKC